MKRSRTLVLTLPVMVVLIFFAAYKYGYQQVRTELAAIKDEEAVKKETLIKYAAYVSAKPEIEKRIAALKEERKNEDPKLIEGQTPSLAAATLQETVKGIVASSGGTISSERVGKPEDLDGFRVISVSIDATLPDVRVLADILYSIESRMPYLVVRELDLRARSVRDPKELVLKLTVAALTTGK